MLTLLTWLFHQTRIKSPAARQNYWLREQYKEAYLYARPAAWITDLILLMWLIISISLNTF